MSQIRLFITHTKFDAEAIYAKLEPAFEEDGLPISIAEINEDEEIFEVSLYCEDDDLEDMRTRFANILNIDENSITVEILPEIDWVQHSLEGLKPVRAGRFFVHGSHDREKIAANDISIEIDAGQAFGTGHHGTTAGCLEMIGMVMRNEHPQNILDLGTGSGVLAIGMAKLYPVKIVASDIDPIATKVAKENIKLNGVASRIDAVTAAGFHHRELLMRAPFDLIVANILARPLMMLAPRMSRALKPNGSIILSGILDSQRDRVLAAYRAQGLYHQSTFHRNGWVTLHLKR
ncbi:50S ribosomal protein L11 methyltransferase [Bartonella sp. HY038]|uniref:50S ribosomal protein L11 methyltransferase n=1 Tax=Bartonella sp. HY038 TaxID=2759660 RepID=UPI0015FD11FB|nr:50S ribosomal protein L11 methyltransferase [Bartonella sp. HY038]